MLRKVLHHGTRAEQVWDWVAHLIDRVFKPAARFPVDPRAVFILALSVFGGFTAAVLDAAPNTLNDVMPHWAVIIWGWLLTLGSLVTLGGMARQTINGVIAEQIGSMTVGVTTIFYAVVALKIVGADATQPLVLVLGWGLACLVRWGQLQSLLNREYEAQLEAKIQAEVTRRLDP